MNEWLCERLDRRMDECVEDYMYLDRVVVKHIIVQLMHTM